MTPLPPEVTAAVRRAEDLVPRYDRLVREAARHAGGTVHGDEGDRIAHSVKGVDRLAEKVAAQAQRGKTVEQALLKVHDINRYTVIFPDTHYTDGVRRLQEYLAGHELTLHYGKNSWDDRFYKGYNARFEDKARPHAAVDPADATDTSPRHRMEVQAHTPASLAAKQDTHDLYKLMRTGAVTEEEADATAELMALRSDTVPKPPGVEALGTRQVSEARPNTPSPQARAQAKAAPQQPRTAEGSEQPSRGPGVPAPHTPPGPPAEDRQRLTPEQSPAGRPDPDANTGRDHDEPSRSGLDPRGLG